jgi:hypothetical protein
MGSIHQFLDASHRETRLEGFFDVFGWAAATGLAKQRLCFRLEELGADLVW